MTQSESNKCLTRASHFSAATGLQLLSQTSPILIDRLDYFDRSIGAPDMI